MRRGLILALVAVAVGVLVACADEAPPVQPASPKTGSGGTLIVMHDNWRDWAEDTGGGKYVDLTGKPDPKGFPVSVRRRKDGQEMVLVPAGSFNMGDGPRPPEGPVHRVRITRAFYMDVSEITLGQFTKYSSEVSAWLIAGGRSFEDVQPAESVTFDEALGYARSVGADLPTEAEWEWAARGDKGWAYPWGDNFDPANANVRGDADEFYGSAPARSFPPSPRGLYDMCGNVGEWCLDYLDVFYYKRSPVDDPVNNEPNRKRVTRGGDYDRQGELCHAYDRIPGNPGARARGLGFRCVVRLPK